MHIITSMRYRSSTALEDDAPGGPVAGALISNNGAPWWTTFGDGGGPNNCVVFEKISVSGRSRLGRAFCHEKNI